MFSEKRKMCSCTRKRSSNVCIPDDLLFMIFLCLPANVLYNIMRFVCRGWYNLIQSTVFISAHLQKQSTTNALLVHHEKINGFVVKPRSHSHGGVLEVENLSFEFVRKAWASCNGLLFVMDRFERKLNCPCYVLNPVTKQYLPLPLFPLVISTCDLLSRLKCCFAYASASSVYKVMHFSNMQSFILSVGVDKAWRDIDMSDISPAGKEILPLTGFGRPMSSGWLTYKGFVYRILTTVPFILSFNVETETFGEIPLFPGFCDLKVSGVGLFGMGSSVCLWTRSQSDRFIFTFWFLKNVKSGEWEKLFDVNLKDKGFNPASYLNPLGWLRSMELLVFRSYTEIMVYEVNTGQVHQTEEMRKMTCTLSSFDHDDKKRRSSFNHWLYVGSLVPLNNLSLI